MSKDISLLIKIKSDIEKTLAIKEARKSFSKFAKYCFNLEIGKIHKEWHKLATLAMKEKQPCVIFAPRGHAKCFSETTVITMVNGSQKFARDCKVGDEVLALDLNTLKFVPAKITAFIENGIKDVYKVLTASGKEIKVTKNHPFLTLQIGSFPIYIENTNINNIPFCYISWKSIKDGLAEGDWVGIYKENYLVWDIVKEIKYIGKEETFGLEIEKYHNHITNGIITHNTTVMAVMRTLFLLGHNPNLRIKIVSHSDKKASDILRQIKEAIETNEKLKEVFPHLEPSSVWSANKILIKRDLWSKDVTIEALGVLSGATGGRADFILFDDIVEFNNTIKYPALINVVKDAFYNNWLNLLEPTGYGWCLIGTIWTQADLHWELKQKPFKYKGFYAINLETLEPIWSEYWTKERLLERYNSMPLRAFARAFCNMPISRDDAIFDREKIEQCMVFANAKDYLKKCERVYMGVDLAISTKKGSANSVIAIIGIIKKKKEEKFVLLHLEYGKWSSPETVNAIIKNYKDWKVDKIIVENNQYQEALIQWLKEFKADLPVESHYTGTQKHDPEIGLPSLALDFERKKWIIPIGKKPHDSDCKCGICKWIDELTMYPFGENDDTVMATWFVRNYYRNKNKNFENVEIDVF